MSQAKSHAHRALTPLADCMRRAAPRRCSGSWRAAVVLSTDCALCSARQLACHRTPRSGQRRPCTPSNTGTDTATLQTSGRLVCVRLWGARMQGNSASQCQASFRHCGVRCPLTPPLHLKGTGCRGAGLWRARSLSLPRHLRPLVRKYMQHTCLGRRLPRTSAELYQNHAQSRLRAHLWSELGPSTPDSAKLGQSFPSLDRICPNLV